MEKLFPDIGVPTFGALVEVDGAEAHSGAAALARDLHRQNKLLSAFRLFRYPASTILADAMSVAVDIKRQLLHASVIGPSWRKDGVTASYTTNEFLVVDPTRYARTEARQRRRAS